MTRIIKQKLGREDQAIFEAKTQFCAEIKPSLSEWVETIGPAFDRAAEKIADAARYPLAPVCYICGCKQTAEHAALPHNDYGVVEDFSVIQCTCGVNSISPYVFTNDADEHASYCRITRYHRWIASRGQE